jgi:hypothetical protein
MRPLSTILLCCAALGCVSDATCPPGYELKGACVPVMASPDSSTPGDGDGDGDDDAGQDASEPVEAGASCAVEDEYPGGFGKPCMDNVEHSDCECDTDYCAIDPFTGATVGYCTRTGCAEDADICPADWTCFEVPSLSFCFAPP